MIWLQAALSKHQARADTNLVFFVIIIICSSSGIWSYVG